MKTRFYILLTGLLTAACITTFGQEIISQFSIYRANTYTIGCDIEENEDGTLLIGAVTSTNTYLYDPEYRILKTTPDGEALDSLSITTPEGMNGLYFTSINEIIGKHFLLRNTSAPDSYIITNFYWDMDDNQYFRMVSIDADLHVNNDISFQVAQADIETFNWDKWFIDTQNDIIISYWVDNIFHVMRIGSDGTVKTNKETNELFPPYYGYVTPPDTMLWYTGFGTVEASLPTYYKLGCYFTASGTYPIHCYFFDEDFNIIGTHWYENYDGVARFSGANTEHITPWDDNSYLMVSAMRYPNGGEGCALMKYDMDHNPICISPKLGSLCYPFDTRIAGNNSVFQLYLNLNNTSWSLSLACLNSDLDLNWDIALPGLSCNGMESNMLIKANGDVLVASGNAFEWDSPNTRIYVYTIHDKTENIAEAATCIPFSTYPNPVKGLLSLRFDDGVEPESIELYDLAGRLVSAKRNSLESIDMNTLSSGVYMMHVTIKDGTSYHEKIVKE